MEAALRYKCFKAALNLECREEADNYVWRMSCPSADGRSKL